MRPPQGQFELVTIRNQMAGDRGAYKSGCAGENDLHGGRMVHFTLQGKLVGGVRRPIGLSNFRPRDSLSRMSNAARALSKSIANVRKHDLQKALVRVRADREAA
jgi:hypothetical protein